MTSRKAFLVWGAAMFAYLVAVFHRSSLGVAGVEAAHRLGVGASMLAVLSVVQLAMYASMQVPAGVLLDRFGPRRMLIAGPSRSLDGAAGVRRVLRHPAAEDHIDFLAHHRHIEQISADWNQVRRTKGNIDEDGTGVHSDNDATHVH